MLKDVFVLNLMSTSYTYFMMHVVKGYKLSSFDINILINCYLYLGLMLTYTRGYKTIRLYNGTYTQNFRWFTDFLRLVIVNPFAVASKKTFVMEYQILGTYGRVNPD